MVNILGSVALAYLAGSGALTNTAVVGRGLVRSARKLAEGNLHEAGVEALAALAAPSLMSFGATAALVTDVVSGAYDLAAPALEAAGDALAGREAA
jgi:hypothetical protein